MTNDYIDGWRACREAAEATLRARLSKRGLNAVDPWTRGFDRGHDDGMEAAAAIVAALPDLPADPEARVAAIRERLARDGYAGLPSSANADLAYLLSLVEGGR